MKKLLLSLVCFALPFSLFSEDDVFGNLVRGILAPPVERPAESQVQTPAPVPVVQQLPFNPDYPNIYLGDNGSQKESIFVTMVMYGQTQQGKKHFVIITGKSSQGTFQKKIIFPSLEDMLHFQGILEGKEYDRIYFYSDQKNEADYTLLKHPRR
ncbi:MAG: hypothetical protein ACSHX8_08275 [Opitutaceae bacterium]